MERLRTRRSPLVSSATSMRAQSTVFYSTKQNAARLLVDIEYTIFLKLASREAIQLFNKKVDYLQFVNYCICIKQLLVNKLVATSICKYIF